MADESWRLPTPVQELAAAVEEPPTRYVQSEQDRPGILAHAAAMPDPLPVIDLSRLPFDADETAKLRSALQTWGLFMATNHGLESLMDGLMGASREFFHLPLEEKQRCSNLVEGKRVQLEGYGGDPVISQDQLLDWNDRLHLTVEPEDKRSLAHWPKHPESFRGLLHEYTAETGTVRDNILRAMARILELDDEDYFLGKIRGNGQAHARFNYYPPCPRPELVFGLKPHSDATVLTVLLVDGDVDGLQVQKDGVWYAVPSVPHALVVNVGDSMEIMSNGIFESPVHRVVTNTEKERLSLAMFYAVDGDAVLEPAGGLVDEKRPARYRSITAKDFVAGLEEHFSKGMRIVDTLKI